MSPHDLTYHQVASCKQTIDLLKKDKDYFSKQVSDMHNKLLYNEEKVVQLHEQLERAKASREELYDKYVASRSVGLSLLLSIC